MSETRIRGILPGSGKGAEVTVRAGRIAAIAAADLPQDAPFVARGLVDLQVNGWDGVDFNGAPVAPADALALCGKLASLGVTRFLPTVITGAADAMAASIRAIAQARESDPLVRDMIAGIHVEGPWISDQDGPRGAHSRADVRVPDLAEFHLWQQISGGLVRLVTLAPELPGALAQIAALAAEGVIVSIGHSNATPDEVEAAAAAGARMSTHLGNGVAGILPRHPNLIWAQLADDRLTAGLIADGHHLSPATFRAMLRAKGPGRAVLVSDTVALGGKTPGIYHQPVGGDVELTADGRIGLAGTPYLAGAATPLAGVVPRAAAMAGIPLAEALALASDAPAALLGLSGLVVGAEADIITFRAPAGQALEILSCHVAGERAA